MSAEKPKKKPPVPFERAVEQLIEKYGYADWAVVVRSDAPLTLGWYVAGDGKDTALDRERAMVLYGELAALQDLILTTQKRRAVRPGPASPPPPGQN